MGFGRELCSISQEQCVDRAPMGKVYRRSRCTLGPRCWMPVSIAADGRIKDVAPRKRLLLPSGQHIN